MTTALKTWYENSRPYFRADILAGITVALALIPEAIAFAFVAGVTPLLSLQTAVMIGLIAATFTGRPGMISASTAAISIVVAPLIAAHGLEYLFACVVLMGVIQLLIGVFRLGKYTTLIPHSVVLGFLNGLAIVIFLAQWDQFQLTQTVLVDGVEQTVKQWLPLFDFGVMLLGVGFTMGVIHLGPKLTKLVPSSLLAIGVMTVISMLLSHFGVYDFRTVADFAGVALVGELPSWHLPQVPLTLETLRIVTPYAVIGALVGLTEAALTLRVLDEMTQSKGRMNREFLAQGLANFVNGFFGGMGGDAMIGQSIVNVNSGGRTRISGIVAALALLGFLLWAGPVVNAIPLAALVGLMFMVVISTFKWESLRYGGRIPRSEYFVIGLVTVVTILADLATAVILGVVVSTVMFAWRKGKSVEVRTQLTADGTKVYKVNGLLFFASTQHFAELLTVEDDPQEVVVDLKYAKVLDISALKVLNDVARRYRERGTHLTVTRPGENCRQLIETAGTLMEFDIRKH